MGGFRYSGGGETEEGVLEWMRSGDFRSQVEIAGAIFFFFFLKGQLFISFGIMYENFAVGWRLP